LEFAEAYYAALNEKSNRKSLEDFYLPMAVLETGNKEPQITWNGHVIDDPVEYRKTMEEDFDFIFYHCQSVDSQIINERYYTDIKAKGRKPEENIAILVMTSGYMRLRERGSGPMKEFSESFTLVPNPGTRGQKWATKRKWLIQNQIFRWVVSHENVGADSMMEVG
jgi:NTF2-related export protein 1/2